MSQIALSVRLPVAEGKLDEALAVMGKLVAATEDEPGTLLYLLHTEPADPKTIWVYELYADQAALDAHSGSTAMAEAMGAFGGVLDGAPEMHILEVSAQKGDAG